MSKPTQQEIMEAVLLEMQKDVAQGEKLKQQTETLRTENWSLERRNEELKKLNLEIEEKEKRLKNNEEDYQKRLTIINQREFTLRKEQEKFNEF